MRDSRRSTLPETMAELLQQLGNISPSRVRLQPPPGTATEKDVTRILDRTNRICELIDGVLVEKVMGYTEASISARLISLLDRFLDQNDLGNLAAPDGTVRLMPKLVRVPDISFIRWENLPNREIPEEPIPDLVPDLAVEVLSKGNTRGEMARKLRDYFLAGVQLVWFVDPRTRTVQVFTAPDQSSTLTEKDTLDGGKLLPGLALPVKQIFSRLPRTKNGAAAKKKPTKPGRKKER